MSGEEANLPNAPFTLYNNFVRKPADAYRNWKNAPGEFESRKNHYEAAKRTNNDKMQQYQCGTEGEDTAACNLYRTADKKLNNVGKHLNSVKNPEGMREKFTNVVRQRNERDVRTLNQVDRYQEAAERTAVARSNLSLASASQSSSSNRAPYQDRNTPREYGGSRSFQEQMDSGYYDSGSDDNKYY